MFTRAECGTQTAKETTTQKECVPKGTYVFIIELFLLIF